MDCLHIFHLRNTRDILTNVSVWSSVVWLPIKFLFLGALAQYTGLHNYLSCVCLQMDVFDAAEKYLQAGHALMILAGKEYGSGSSRDWAAKGPFLLVRLLHLSMLNVKGSVCGLNNIIHYTAHMCDI